MFKYPIAVTIDTNILDSSKYDLGEGSTLQLLKNYVEQGMIKVVLSNIVVRESKKHLAKQVSKVCGVARKLRSEVLKESTEHLIKSVGLNRLLEISKDKEALINKSEEMFDSFIEELNAEILGTDLIELEGIIDDYFEINPPFEEGEKKRKEFPDAFIANQIRKRFGENEDVIIVSNDNGFKEACKRTPNHFFFNTLGELFNAINKEKEEAYAETVNIIKELQFSISSDVLDYIKSNENIDVRGMSWDKDGIPSGFEYDEFYLYDISNFSFSIHSVDKITDKSSIVTILCKANILADCYYEDFNNASWDFEIKDYGFVETIKIREEHDVRFGCRIELDRIKKEFKVFPFTIILGGDSRKNRFEIDNQVDIDFEDMVDDMEREYFGFNSLDNYESYLQNNLLDSSMSQEITKRFEEINNLKMDFEEFCYTYELLLEYLDKNSYRIVKLIAKDLRKITDFPIFIDDNDIDENENEIEKVKDWIETKKEIVNKVADTNKLPDVINYGDTIIIEGVDGSEISLSIDEIMINPTEGNDEMFDITLRDKNSIIAMGYVKLTVGYLHFDEEGNVADGIEDNIEYEFLDITKKLDDFIATQRRQIEKESEIIKIIEKGLKI